MVRSVNQDLGAIDDKAVVGDRVSGVGLPVVDDAVGVRVLTGVALAGDVARAVTHRSYDVMAAPMSLAVR